MDGSLPELVFERLPLAEAALRLLDFAYDDQLLDTVFEQHRGRSYEGTLRFPDFVQLLAQGLFAQQRSAHQTLQHADADDQLDVSFQAFYGKLRRVPINLSLGLFDAVSARLHTLPTAAIACPLPASLAEFSAWAFDGKKLKYVLRRLKPLRGLRGNIYGGKLLVVQDLATQQAVAIQAVADGESADNPLVPELIERVRARPTEKRRLWVGD